MATIKGQNLRIFIGNEVVAASLQCEVQVQLQTKTISTKDTEGDFAELLIVNLAWNARSSSAVSNDPNRNDAASLQARIGQTVHVQFALADGNQNSDMGDILVAGDAIISDVRITAENRRRGTCDVVLTGCKNLLHQLCLIVTADGHYIRTADGHLVAAEHEE